MESNNLSEAQQGERTLNHKSAFTRFKQSPKVNASVAKYSGASFEATLSRAKEGDQDALYTIVFNALTSIVETYQKLLPGKDEQEQFDLSGTFFTQFLHQLKTQGLTRFDPQMYPSSLFPGPFAKFKHYLSMKVIPGVLKQIQEPEGTQKGSPQEDQANVELQTQFTSYLKTKNPIYAKLFKAMTQSIPPKELLDIFAWKSLQSLLSKVRVIQGLYKDFLTKEPANE